jgi:hypothetical protein
MIVYVSLLIPLIVTLFFYVFNKHKFAWWEFFVPLLSVLLAVVISKLIIDHTSVQFTEYWGSTVVAVYEEEPYNYWHHETCSEQYQCGTDSDGNPEYCTRYYDCSHQDDVGPSWWAETNLGEYLRLSEKEYEEISKQFKTKSNITETHKNYDPNDKAVGSKGTKFEGQKVGEVSYVYQYVWDGTDNTRKAYTSVHTYENRVKASDLSIFNIDIVSEELADSLGLFEYPEYNDSFFSSSAGLDYPTILGKTVSKETQEKFKRLNGKFGVSNQLRLWLLVFDNKPMSIAQYQKNYWVNGNKNELVVCIGTKGNEITWSQAFSWAHSADLTAAAQNKVLELYSYQDSIKSSTPVLNEQTWDDYYNYLNQNLNKFERRSFEEFSYITVEPSKGALIFIFVFAFVISIGVNLIVIYNDIN